MAWRTIVITGVAKLDYKMGYMVVRKAQEITRIHLSEIDILIIESMMVSLTSTLLIELSKNKSKIIFCDEKHNPNAEVVAYYGSHDTSLKVRQQIQWDDYTKKELWTCIVREKIRNQKKLLLEMNRYDAANLLQSYLDELEFFDTSNREGHAAKVYFNSLFGKDFSRSDDNPINATLNYGYNIILSYFNREIVSNGYLTQIGIFHNNIFNYYNFSCDIMEPFRYVVDKKVAYLSPDQFTQEEKYEILSILNDIVRIDGKHQSLSNAIHIYTKSVFVAIEGRDVSKVKFISDEL